MPFRTSEISFLTEYCHVMQPLARSLDILQVEKKVSSITCCRHWLHWRRNWGSYDHS